MKLLAIPAVLFALAATLSAAPASLEGTYVEARTAEIFAGGCVINSEAGTSGREAVLAWKVDRGLFNGVALDGLTVMAAVSGDANLGVHEIGGEQARTRTAIVVDERATTAQRERWSRWPARCHRGWWPTWSKSRRRRSSSWPATRTCV